MAEGAVTLKGLRAQMAAAAQAQAEERRSQAVSPAPSTNTTAKPQGCRPVIDGAALRVDDRLRVAKERREEAERKQALRESQIMERERKAKMQVERQLEERQKKVVEQRRKEEQKRMAVEEKRKQKQEEEKEHYEAVMRRTLERSQRVEQRQKRWSWGGLSTDSDGRASATHLHPPPRGPVRSRSIDRQKNSMTTSVSADGALDRSLSKQERTFTSPGRQRPPSPSIPLGRNRSPSPSPNPSPKRTPSPAAAKQNARTRPPSPGIKHPPSPQPTTAKPPPIQKPSLTPTGPPTLRKRDSRSKDLGPVQMGSPLSSDSSKLKDKDGEHLLSGKAQFEDTKTGTNSAAEAAKILAENRRLMREQKEKEEQLRIQREEEEKLRKDEEERLAEQARLKREEEERKLAEERRVKEEEQARIAEEEQARLAAEEALKQAEMQREREEAEAKALEEAEKVRQERDRIMQQNQQERMERKKRIEEIMKRTRKGEQNDFKRDGDKYLQDNEDDGQDQIGFDTRSEEGQMDDITIETHECGDGVAQREEPLGYMNGRVGTDKKNGPEDTQAVSPIPTGRLVEGSEFLNEQDSTKVELVSGRGSKSNQWSFEELMDLSVHSKTHNLMEVEDCDPVMIHCDGPDGTKGSPVSSLHSSSQAIEALSAEI
uniref:MAP7 domain-containing protein 3 isoform X11 n=1 Tax=Doryrhamphus excisus TaxID=161450 RepID=UPI0025ADD40D|nr:MAP7 domain-containing protein 3 isoform X11 [Doryrhamphus excisus]